MWSRCRFLTLGVSLAAVFLAGCASVAPVEPKARIVLRVSDNDPEK